MKLKNIYSLMAGALMLFAACSPDEYSLGGKQYDKDDLTCPEAYTVDINGNKVDLASKISGCTPLWVTPSGRSQKENLTLELPFAGDYSVTFGADTRAGAVYGDPYKFTIPQNDFTLLSSPLWFYLSDADYKTGDPLPDAETLAAGVSKKWYPCLKDYGLGCTGPVMSMTPYDPTNTGNYTEEEKANNVFKDVTFGRANWAPNWDPGYGWYVASNTDPYMDSYMTFSMDAAHGCVLKEYRGESGAKGSSTGTNLAGKFQLELTDPTHPTMTFSDTYSMHDIGSDERCSNYTQSIIIAELTPYYMALITKRTNSEGPWYLVWNFVSEDVIKTDGACIPASEASFLKVSDPVLPTYEGLSTSLFTSPSGDVNYVGNKVTYTINEEKPYSIEWWNGAANANKWQDIVENYNNTWAPSVATEQIEESLVLEYNSAKKTYSYTYGDQEGEFTLTDNTIVFDKEVNFFTAKNDNYEIPFKGKVFTILSMVAGESMTIGVPRSKDANGNVTSYNCVNLNTKALGGGSTGPTVIALGTDYTADGCSAIDSKKYYRLVFYNEWNSGKGLVKDISKVKLKKGQTMTVKFTLKPDFTWTSAPKAALCDNALVNTWEPDVYNSHGITASTSAENTVTITNTTDSTVSYSTGSLQLSINLDGTLQGFDGETVPDLIQSVSMTIQ